ncbi:energy transducer TonB [Marinibactrum halimedae]|uniref:Protein TonB n=1 Tax=Marinibactrum halimedae TaxID=1444977 RepID=A0AA37WP10_9GAMM|nr:energy transducer TonB [Marinibactrum halimedae]MCD9460829.1 energy transducer TonB [Marinibactrum halimedae]GLS26706.1 hypothetical protein GCM10007877_24230 [Marinibactrum halimedae]
MRKLITIALGMSVAAMSMAKEAPSKIVHVMEDGTVGIVKDIKPEYPRHALKNKVQGYVLVSYNVNAQGAVEEITVIEESPAKVFTSAARRALASSVFTVETKDGQKAAMDGLKRRYEFQLVVDGDTSFVDLASR